MAGDQEVQVDVRSRTMTVEAEGALARVVVEEAVLTGKTLQVATPVDHFASHCSNSAEGGLEEREAMTAYASAGTAVTVQVGAVVTDANPHIRQQMDYLTMEVGAECCQMKVIDVRIRRTVDLEVPSVKAVGDWV